MKYTWYECLQMVANGQPMHCVGHGYYMKYERNAVFWFDKYDNELKISVVVDDTFMNSTFVPYIKQVQLSEDEKIILRNVDSMYRWIARDGNEVTYLYEMKPFKGRCSWGCVDGDFRTIKMFNHLFKDIKWEDDEPKLIADLIK